MKSLLQCATVAAASIALLMTGSCSDNSNTSAADGSNAAIENIMTRTSVRTYEPGRDISADTVEMLLRAAMSAPTAVNAQPWKFIVVRNAEVRGRLAEALPNAGDKLTAAPLTVVVCGDTSKFFKPQPEYWVQDCSAATENLLLAAHATGLGAVWCGVYPDQERVKVCSEALGLDGRFIPLCVVPVGYPAGENTPKDKWKVENVETIE